MLGSGLKRTNMLGQAWALPGVQAPVRRLLTVLGFSFRLGQYLLSSFCIMISSDHHRD